jgi:hypothetical protein
VFVQGGANEEAHYGLEAEQQQLRLDRPGLKPDEDAAD